MPSPNGHALAGVAVAWSVERLPASSGLSRRRSITFAALCAGLAAAPDLDLIYPPSHRTVTHSVGAVALVLIVATVVTEWVTRRGAPAARARSESANAAAPASGGGAARAVENVGREGQEGQEGREGREESWWRGVGSVAVICTAAYASHLLLDWLGSDPSWPAGIQALWPLSRRWYISGLNLFPYLERREMLSSTSIIINMKAIAGEVAILGPFVGLLGLIRTKISN